MKASLISILVVFGSIVELFFLIFKLFLYANVKINIILIYF